MMSSAYPRPSLCALCRHHRRDRHGLIYCTATGSTTDALCVGGEPAPRIFEQLLLDVGNGVQTGAEMLTERGKR